MPITWISKFNDLANLAVSLLCNQADQLVWRVEGVNYTFSVGEVWQAIRESDNVVDWYKFVWYAQVIPMHSFIVWLIIGGYLKTQDRLKSYEINPNVVQVCSLLLK